MLGWVVPCEIVREMYVAQLLLTLSSANAEQIGSFIMG
jgi:hypothetical protein